MNRKLAKQQQEIIRQQEILLQKQEQHIAEQERCIRVQWRKSRYTLKMNNCNERDISSIPKASTSGGAGTIDKFLKPAALHYHNKYVLKKEPKVEEEDDNGNGEEEEVIITWK